MTVGLFLGITFLIVISNIHLLQYIRCTGTKVVDKWPVGLTDEQLQ